MSTTYGLNACPPLLVGVGVATSVETAALLSKKALMRPLGSYNENERAASMEKLLEDGINEIGLGPQGMGGKYSVMGVHIENTARHFLISKNHIIIIKNRNRKQPRTIYRTIAGAGLCSFCRNDHALDADDFQM